MHDLCIIWQSLLYMWIFHIRIQILCNWTCLSSYSTTTNVYCLLFFLQGRTLIVVYIKNCESYSFVFHVNIVFYFCISYLLKLINYFKYMYYIIHENIFYQFIYKIIFEISIKNNLYNYYLFLFFILLNFSFIKYLFKLVINI